MDSWVWVRLCSSMHVFVIQSPSNVSVLLSKVTFMELSLCNKIIWCANSAYFWVTGVFLHVDISNVYYDIFYVKCFMSKFKNWYFVQFVIFLTVRSNVCLTDCQHFCCCLIVFLFVCLIPYVSNTHMSYGQFSRLSWGLDVDLVNLNLNPQHVGL